VTERGNILAFLLTGLVLLFWLRFLVHVDPRFPGSAMGGALGIAGNLLLLVPLAYSAAKRLFTLRGPRLRTFLAVHIYASLVGTILALLHTGHKFDNPVGILLTLLMLIVVLSGFTGHYLLQQCSQQLSEKRAAREQLEASLPPVFRDLTGAVGAKEARRGVRLAVLFPWLLRDSQRRATARHAWELVDAAAALEASIALHERMRSWFRLWLPFHLVLTGAFYLLWAIHVLLVTYYGAALVSPVRRRPAAMILIATAALAVALTWQWRATFFPRAGTRPGDMPFGAPPRWIDRVGWVASPEALSAAHADLSTQCQACHAAFRPVPDAKCRACHLANRELMTRRDTAFHAEASRCTTCHLEHHGRTGRISRMEHAVLNPDLACSVCHVDRHRAFFGDRCLDCHHVDTWTIGGFRHPSPRSRLCAECHRPPPSHTMMHFEMVDRAVTGQRDAIVNQCWRCHTTDSWNNIVPIGLYEHH